MFYPGIQTLESEFFRGLNQLVEPMVRAGFGAPLFSPAGAILVETKGRKSSKQFNVPLLASVFGDVVVVGTVRRRSQWVKNLAASPNVRYWIGGREREATALVVASEIETTSEMPERTRWLAALLKQHSALWGTSFAILIPRDSAKVKP